MNTFDRERGILCIELPLAPADNQLKRTSRFGHYPTAEYCDWLEIAAPQLREVLADWQPDTTHWWAVDLTVELGTRDRDQQNHTKALLDLLCGAQVAQKALTLPSGRTVKKGCLYRSGALFDDDCRIRELRTRVEWIRCAEPSVMVFARPAEPPRDWKAQQQAQERQQREIARVQAREARAAEKTAEKAHKAAAKKARVPSALSVAGADAAGGEGK